MGWLYLGLAILSEIIGTTCMKISNGFAKIIPSILMFTFYAISFVFMSLSLKFISISTAYAVWSGVGVALITLIGTAMFKEPINLIKIVSIILIILGVIGLHLQNNR
jgi:small multidrug resistance pump